MYGSRADALCCCCADAAARLALAVHFARQLVRERRKNTEELLSGNRD